MTMNSGVPPDDRGDQMTGRYGKLLVLAFLAVAGLEAYGQQAERLVVSMPSDFPPHYLLDENQQPDGFAVEVLEAVAGIVGVQLEYRVFDDWASTQEALRSGEADLIPNMGITLQRTEFAAFTDPVETFAIGLFVRDTNQEIKGLKDLAGKRAAGVERNVGLRLLKAAGNIEVVTYDAQEHALFDLLAGEVEAFAYPIPVAWKSARDAGIDGLIKQVGTPLKEIKRAIAVHKGDNALLARMNKGVREFVGSPAYGEIYSRWFGAPEPYWTVQRVLWVGGGGGALLLVLIIISMTYWRYRTTVVLYRDLKDSVMERDQAQKALQQLNLELESRVDQRTSELQREIHERKQTEQRLRQSEKSLAKAQRIANLGNWEWDIQGGRLSWSEEIYRIFGLVPGEFEASYEAFLETIHPDDLGKVTQAVDRALNDHVPYLIEHRVVRPDGELRYVQEQGEVSWNDSGKPVRMLGVVHDVTERKRMESTMVQTEKMMSVGGLAAGMAHELNNPLGGMLQGLQNIRRRLSPDLEKNREIASQLGLDLELVRDYTKQRQIDNFILGMHEAGERASAIVRNMLQFSRKAEIKKQAVDIVQLVEQTLELAEVDYNLKKRFDFRNIEITREFEPGIPAVQCIPSEIQQVLLNLLRNAAQSFTESPREGADPQIVLAVRTENGLLYIELEDNGPGMDEATRRRVFEPFFTTREPGEGTGLGLSVSYFIICDEHGGRMEVESVPGQGSKFIIGLPLG
ncbi:MAG: transporter substrate-binding domain-containing protein [Candidatus Sedimenticola sp. 20ELBAFRAG]